MRKQNCSNTPALKDEGRLIYSVVRSRNCKRPNALKHGVFSDAVLIPGEDSGEYKQLLAELMDEWKPAGPTFARRGHRACKPEVETAASAKIHPNQAHCGHVRSSLPFL